MRRGRRAKRWVEKLLRPSLAVRSSSEQEGEDDPAEDPAHNPVPAAPAPNTPVPRDADPDGEWTYDNPKPAKTGVTEGATAGAGLTIVGFLTLIWEKISGLPESIVYALTTLAQKPYFWALLAGAGVFGFVFWRRRQQKQASGE